MWVSEYTNTRMADELPKQDADMHFTSLLTGHWTLKDHLKIMGKSDQHMSIMRTGNWDSWAQILRVQSMRSANILAVRIGDSKTWTDLSLITKTNPRIFKNIELDGYPRSRVFTIDI